MDLTMSLYTINKKSQQVFSPGEGSSLSQNPRVSIRTVAEDCSNEQSSALASNDSPEEKKKKSEELFSLSEDSLLQIHINKR